MATITKRYKNEDVESGEILEIDEGCFLGTYPSWNLHLNVKGHWTNNKCKHCVLTNEKDEDGDDIWMIPRIAQASTEGGYSSTAICIDCLLEVLAAGESDE